MEIRNNISFGSLGIKGVLDRDKLTDFRKFIADNNKLITKLEKEYDTDVFLSENMDFVTLENHLTMKMQPIPVAEFTERNTPKIIEALQTAIKEYRAQYCRGR